MSTLTNRIATVLREHQPWSTWGVRDSFWCQGCQRSYPDDAFTAHVAEWIAALFTEETDRHRKCVCHHPVGDHDMYRGGKCQANMVSRPTPCPCTHWRPQKRLQWVLKGEWTAVEPVNQPQEDTP